MSIPAKPIDLPDKEVVLEKLAMLPAALFEMLVVSIDKLGIVPGREAPQLIRAAELIRLAETRENGILRLWINLCKLTSEDGENAVNLSGKITPVRVGELVGILINPEEGNLGEKIARYAFAQVLNTINSDLLRRIDELLVSALAWNLAEIPVQEGKCSNLLAFAVLCHDHAAGLGKIGLKEKLKVWIDSVCLGSSFSIESIRSNFPMQDYGRLYRLAVEIAWPMPINKNILPPEAYIRWGRLRQRISYDILATDRHQTVTSLLDSIVSNEALGIIQVDHVEILLDFPDTQIPWEYKPGASIDDEDPILQPYPIVVRSASRSQTNTNRPCPRDLISNHPIARNNQGERFLEFIQDHGVFVTATHTPNIIKKALPFASIGIWSRKAYSADERLLEALNDCQVDDLPSRVHGRRTISEPGSIWRDVVALFDPNLPPFKFSYEVYDSAHQINTNAALG